MSLKSHSISAVASSMPFFKGVLITNICRAANWSQPFMLVKYYKLNIRSKFKVFFSRTVISSVVV